MFGKRLQVSCIHLQNYTIGGSLLSIRIRIPKSNIPYNYTRLVTAYSEYLLTVATENTSLIRYLLSAPVTITCESIYRFIHSFFHSFVPSFSKHDYISVTCSMRVIASGVNKTGL